MSGEDHIQARRLAAALAAEQYQNKVLTKRIARLQPAYDELRVIVRSLQNNSFWKARQTWFTVMHRIGLSRTGAAPLYDPQDILANPALDRYERWRADNDYRPSDAQWMRAVVPVLRFRPTFSVIVPTYNTPQPYLRAMLDSVIAQIYPDWELCIADDASTDSAVPELLKVYGAVDDRVRTVVRSTNGHIAAATNTALALARGEFVVLLDHDDLLSEDALFMMAVRINAVPDVDMIYSDEDKIDDDGRRSQPFFKPDWSPETLLSRMYTGHLGVYRTALVRDIGGFREKYSGSQDYDLVLRLSERTQAIEHLPRILYHWRLHPASTTQAMAVKPYAQDAAVRALTDALARRGEVGRVETSPNAAGAYTIRYAIDKPACVSVVVSIWNHTPQIERTVRSTFEKTAYPAFEIILVDGTDRNDVTNFAQSLSPDDRSRVRCVRLMDHRSSSAAHNHGASIALGKHLLFLAPGSEIVDPDWMSALVEYSERRDIGAAGARIVASDGRLIHAGLVLGMGGIAGFVHRGAPGDTRGYFDRAGAVTNVSAVSTAAMIVRRDTFEHIGRFDPQLDIGYAGVDFCLRILREGLRIVYVPHAHVVADPDLLMDFDTSEAAPHRDNARALLERRWSIGSIEDRYYNRQLTLVREDVVPGP